MATTTKGLRYPVAGDNPAVHTDFLNLATDVDTELDDYVLKTTPVFTASIELGTSADIIFEGTTNNNFETTLTVVDPTADRTITFPDATGTVTLLTATQTLTNKSLTSPVITIAAGTLTLPTVAGTFALTSDITPSATNENFALVTAFMLGGM